LLFLAIMALISALLAVRVVQTPHRLRRPSSDEYGELAGASTGAFIITALLSGQFMTLLPVLTLFLGVAAVMGYFAHRLSMPGILWTSTQVTGLIVSAAWGYFFITEAGFPMWLEVLAVIGFGLSMLLAISSLASGFAREAILTHELWRLPVAAPVAPTPSRRAKVSLQLPCYAEPPEVVKETMNRLAKLDYDNFEVLVCDNNTKDERLWKPLEEHCAALNQRMGRECFRFFHVAPLEGAKAGALNFCLEQMAPDAEIIGVIDADYFSRKDFLSRLVPFFEDPELGYIQTPHDYRAYEHSNFLTACYWEYMPANKVFWPGVSEYGGAFTIGTMCLLRTEALRKAGGWAEWCLTEDSEVSVRLRAVGYRGLYFGETFGRGLIPETFDDYKKQRFRWVAGPVQQLRRHWRLFLPAPFAAPMPGWTKLLEITRCVAPLLTLGSLVTGAVATIAMGITLATGHMTPVNVPNVSWLILLLVGVTWCLRTMHQYRLSGCDRVPDMVRGEIARASLTHVTLMAGVAGLSNRPLAWRRTPKFGVENAEPSPFASTMAETRSGLTCVALALLVLLSAGLWGKEFAMLLAMGLAFMAVRFFCAPLMASMAIRHATRTAAPEPHHRLPAPRAVTGGHAKPRPMGPPAREGAA
jgi:cellulose synthase/poly-beta-1,6-N-acetylglucosamine synthase-like glycosyltransferase